MNQGLLAARRRWCSFDRITSGVSVLALAVGGCGRAARPAQGPSVAMTTPEAMAVAEPEMVATSSGGAPARAPIGALPALAAHANVTAPSITSAGAVADNRAREMLDIEAHLTVEVDGIVAAAGALRAFAKQYGGVIVDDTVTEQRGSTGASLTIRVPAQQIDAFLSSIDGVGQVRSRNVTARDIGKEYYDATLRLENLRVTMKRYEDILSQAKEIKDILQIESEITRLRGEIEQIEGNLRWMQDRVARATVRVALVPRPSRELVAEPTFVPEAKLYPGLRLTEVTDLRGEDGDASYFGGGISISFSRSFSIDFDGLRRSGRGFPTEGIDLFLATVGGEFYSDFLGGGRRKFLNPILGWTAGYARLLGKNEGVLGFSAGLELFKTKAVTIDLQGRAFGMFFSSAGSHVAVQPILGANVAF